MGCADRLDRPVSLDSVDDCAGHALTAGRCWGTSRGVIRRLAWSYPTGPAGPLHRYWLVSRPTDADTAELEILHLGPYFTGEGVFRLRGDDGKTTVSCTEVFSIPGGRLVEWPARLAAAGPTRWPCAQSASAQCDR